MKDAIFFWLCSIAVLLTAMILLGGAVRLTDSGLSITDWRPIMGALPPLGAADWDAAFFAYQQIPQYLTRPAITLDEFKVIFWWEWVHRFAGRVLGVALAVPFLFFLWRGWLSKREAKHIFALLLLVGLQGVIGWVMVLSGLSERVSVAPLLLTLHFGLAMVIVGWVFFLLVERVERVHWQPSTMTFALAAFTFVQLLLGAMVAGMDGGVIYNDFLWGINSPLTANLAPTLDSIPFWQSLHRVNGWALLGLAAFYLWQTRSKKALFFVALLCGQIGLGLLTLFSGTFLPLALLHQFGGLVCWVFALILLLKQS